MLINKKANKKETNQRIIKMEEEIHTLIKKNWERKECDGCKFYNPECRQGVCYLYPYQKQKKREVKEKEVHDTG